MHPVYRCTPDFLLKDKVFLASTTLWKTSLFHTKFIATISLRSLQNQVAAILPRFAYGDFKGDDIKVLLQSKQTITTTLLLSAESSHFVVKAYQIGQRRSPFHKSLLSTPSPHFVLRTFGNSFQDWLNHLPRDQSKADQFP